MIRNERCADDNHAGYEHDAHEEGEPKPAGCNRVSVKIELPRRVMEQWISGRYHGARMQEGWSQEVPARVCQERDARNAELDDESLPLQYLRHFLEEIGSFHFLLRGRPSDII